MWSSDGSIGGLLNFYSLGWWIILCVCIVIYGILSRLKVKTVIIEKASFLTVFLILCLIFTIFSVLFMFHTGREELISGRAILGGATVWGGGFAVVYYLVSRFKKNKARNILVSLAFIAAVYVAADGVRVILFYERNFGCEAQAERKREEQAEEKRLAEQRIESEKTGKKPELSDVAITVTSVPHFWERFFEASQCLE